MAAAAGVECLVLDSLEQFDGLERLIILAVGLDEPISDLPEEAASRGSSKPDDQARSDADQRTRSRLYRAVTRAHMQVLVINELISGGWLETHNSRRLTSWLISGGITLMLLELKSLRLRSHKHIRTDGKTDKTEKRAGAGSACRSLSTKGHSACDETTALHALG